MKNGIATLKAIVPATIALLFLGYIIFKPKGYDRVYELSVLVLTAYVVISSSKRLLRKPRKFAYRILAISGPALLLLAILWTFLASNFQIPLNVISHVFFIFLGTGAIAIGCSVYIAKTREDR
jgi:hypothetical membrane protein